MSMACGPTSSPPVLQQLTTLVPMEVQITKMSGDVQGDGTKKCTLTIDGVAAGEDPRRVAEELRTAIAEQFSKTYKEVSSTFRSLEDGAESAVLNGKTWPTAMFAINVQLSSGPDAPIAPLAPRTTKR
jgi:hypothetical protein